MAKQKPKQGHLQGMEPPSIEELDDLADRYVALRDKRMRLAEDETNKRDLLHVKMKEHKLTSYEYDGKVIEIVADEKIKVRKKKEDKDAD